MNPHKISTSSSHFENTSILAKRNYILILITITSGPHCPPWNNRDKLSRRRFGPPVFRASPSLSVRPPVLCGAPPPSHPARALHSAELLGEWRAAGPCFAALPSIPQDVSPFTPNSRSSSRGARLPPGKQPSCVPAKS